MDRLLRKVTSSSIFRPSSHDLKMAKYPNLINNMLVAAERKRRKRTMRD